MEIVDSEIKTFDKLIEERNGLHKIVANPQIFGSFPSTVKSIRQEVQVLDKKIFARKECKDWTFDEF